MPKSIKGSTRSISIDIIKTVAISSVVLYHLELQQYGYLGVDIFLVLGGYLTGKSIQNALNGNSYTWTGFLRNRISRLLPLVIIASTLSLLIGYFLMLPDDYENLAESVVASNLLSNNILQCITTKNYWDVVNNYKPLMHTWYIGVLFEAYLVIAVSIAIVERFVDKEKRQGSIFALLTTMSVLSLMLYLMPTVSDDHRFYLIPYRLFEVSLGCCLPFIPRDLPIKGKRTVGATVIICSAVVLGSLILETPVDRKNRLIAVVFATLLCLLALDRAETPVFGGTVLEHISKVGKACFSIYIWHQVIIAFYRYSIATNLDWRHLFMIFLIVGIVTPISYELFEIRMYSDSHRKLKSSSLITLTLLFVANIFFAGNLYIHSGVVRDVPELGISKDNVGRGMHKEYNDSVYDLQKPFASSASTKVLVIGDSFARDFVNILRESNIEDLDISYYYYTQLGDKLDCDDIINQADVVFFAIFRDFDDLPVELSERYNEDDVYVVGVKNFGESNGIVYSKRFFDNYENTTVRIDDAYVNRDVRQRDQYGENYIDMLEPVKAGDREVYVFTPDCMFISQDCRHLTRAGAQYYSQHLDLRRYLFG